MRNLDEIKIRYFKEPFNRRLGHLASDLLRISTFLENPKNTAAVNDIIEESKFFIEWTANDAPYNIQEFFADIQPKLALWQLRLENVSAKAALKKCSREWSRQLIRFAGLSKRL